MEFSASSNCLIDDRENETIIAKKPEWEAPAFTVLDLSLETCDGLIPSFDLKSANFVS